MSNIEYDIISSRIVEGLRVTNMSQAELARRTGINSSSICMYVQGYNIPKRQNIEKIADAMGVSVGWLYGKTGMRDIEVSSSDIDILSKIHELNSIGKEKLLSYCNDLVKIDEYTTGSD